MIVFIIVGIVASSGYTSTNNLITVADSFYALRDVDFDQNILLASSTNIDRAISIYRDALQMSSGADREEATWKLMRAYFFKGMYTTIDSEEKKIIYDKGKEVGAKGLRGFPESEMIHMSMAVIWGVWGEECGVIQAINNDVVQKIRYHCEKVLEFEEGRCKAIAYRIYGRLHFKTPKIPLILSWPSKDESLRMLEEAYKCTPNDLFAKQYLAETLYERGQKVRAINLMEDIINTEKIVIGVVEDAFIINEAKITLVKWKKS
jgi:hypothetical protein